MNKTTLALATIIGMASTSLAQGNLLALNSGFELGSPAGWYMWIDEISGGNAMFQTVEPGRSGGHSLQMTVKRPTREVWQIQLNLPKWEAKPNTFYRLTFWAKGPGPVRVSVTDPARNWAYLGGFDAAPGPEWTRVSGEFNTTTQIGSGSIGLSVGMGKMPGVYHLDDFFLEEVSRTTTD